MLYTPGRDQKLTVSRETVFFSSLQALLGPTGNLQSPRYKWKFLGESGYGIGVTRDWFLEVSRQISDPATGLLEVIPDAPTVVAVNPRGREQANYRNLYKAIGRFLGYSFASLIPMSIPFPTSFYARLLGEPVMLEDIREEDPLLYRSLRFSLEASRDELGGLELTIGGRAFELTTANRIDLINRKLNEPLRAPDLFDIIRTGFADVVPVDRLVPLFTAAQLQRILFGAAEIDAREIVIRVGYDARHLERALLSVVRSFSQTHRRLFVKFVTGSTQFPVGGFAEYPITVRLIPGAGDEALPRAFTCFYSLGLPNYSGEAVLRQRLIYAIENSQGMQD